MNDDNITERKKLDDTRMFLMECGSKGDDFFQSLAQYLASSLDMDFVCIDRLEGDLLTAHTVAVYFDGRFEDNISYTLHDTPCGEVVGKEVCCFPEDVRHRFQKDAVLQDMKAESYVGVSLWSHDHRPIGLIAVIGRRPLTEPQLAESILKLVAIRAAGELERRKAEEKLRQSEALIRTILDTVDEGFAIINRDFRILTANKAYCRQAGGCEKEIIGCHCYEASHKTSRPCFEDGEECAVHLVFATGEPHTALHRHMDPAGNILYVETKAYPIRDAAGEITSAVETITNITEKRLLEEERLKTQKLEAIGTLAGGIAHDFNNLLQGIFGYISLAKMHLAKKDPSYAMLEQAERALHMSVNLTSQLLTFSKGGKPAKRRMHLRPLLENSAQFALSGSRSECQIIADEDLWAVEIDEGQIGQVIQNIVLNADQAMPEGGTIVITAKNASPPEQSHYKLLGPGKHVEVSIRDTGIGIPEKYLHKVFDPYFTTKEKGSGLGLATSYSIIKNHGGIIVVESELGAGTTFFIYLPAVEANREIREIPAATPGVRKAKILVMDDEELVQDIAVEMIKVLGHEVDSAKHGQSVLEKYRAAIESGRPYDIVILDLTVRGGMGGRETIEQLLAIDPDVRAIVSSGYSEDVVISEYYKFGFKACLSKPYKLEELRDAINVLLS